MSNNKFNIQVIDALITQFDASQRLTEVVGLLAARVDANGVDSELTKAFDELNETNKLMIKQLRKTIDALHGGAIG